MLDDDKHIYDTIIIGGGISGLSASYHINEKNSLIIEQNESLGGKVLTRSQHGINYDLGAIFAYDKEYIPFDINSSGIFEETGPISILMNKKLIKGKSVYDCLKQLVDKKSDFEILEDLKNNKIVNLSNCSNYFYRLLNHFFQVIHPGEMHEYIPERYPDALITWNVNHYINGNFEIINEFKKNILSDVLFNAEVYQVEEKDSLVEIKYRKNEINRFIKAKKVIVTGSGTKIKNIIKNMSTGTEEFLNNLSYGTGTIVAICLKDILLSDFSYIVTPNLPFNTIIRNKTDKDDQNILFFYYINSEAEKLKTMSNKKIIKYTLKALNSTKILKIKPRNIHFIDIKKWDVIGPIINNKTYGDWNTEKLFASERIILSGDYTFLQKENPIPYGLIPGILSGKQVANLVKTIKEDSFKPHFLIKGSIYELTDDFPTFHSYEDECTIAYYGLVLMSEKDPLICEYLLHNNDDNLWEYQHGYGHTSEDSALVLEGLQNFGVKKEVLDISFKKLVNQYYCSDTGGFKTVVKNCLAEYWAGVTAETTAHIGYLLHKHDSLNYKDELDRSADFVVSVQNEDGSWSGRWFPSLIIPTYYSIRFLLCFGEKYMDEILKARSYLLVNQKKNGGWNNSIIDTSAAILSFIELGLYNHSVIKAKLWLLKNKSTNGWKGEPVLYYWLEREGKKLFFHSHDKGEITTAWAKIALEGKVTNEY